MRMRTRSAKSAIGRDAGRAGARPSRPSASWAALALLLLLWWPSAFFGVPPYAAAQPPVVILSSLKIGPYETLAEAMRQSFGGREVRILYLDETPGAAAQISRLAPSAILTVGQEALKQALPQRGNTPLVFTMVLFPHEILAAEAPGVSGIAMVPSPRQQLLILRQGLGISRVTLFYNPDVTESLVGHFKSLAPPDLQVRAVPLSSDAELIAKLPEALSDTEGVLLVPDPTVLTEQGLKSIITSCYSAGLPVVGFSPMYLEMGAALTLSVSPAEVARNAATLAAARSQEASDLLDNVTYLRSCTILVNTRAVAKLHLKVDQRALKSLGTLQWSGG